MQTDPPNRKTGETWLGFESTFDNCRVVVEPMTKNTFGLVISTDPRIGESLLALASSGWRIPPRTLTGAETGLLQYNMNMARPHIADFSQKSLLERKCSYVSLIFFPSPFRPLLPG